MKTRIIQSHWDLNPLEIRIMTIVTKWGKKEDKPIPSREIVNVLVNEDFLEPTIRRSIQRLKQKGYLQKSEHFPCSYVQLRTIKI